SSLCSSRDPTFRGPWCSPSSSFMFGPNRQCRQAQDLLLGSVADGQTAKVLQVLPDLRHTRPRPIGTEQSLVRDLLQPGKVLQQGLWRNSTYIQKDISMPPHQKECGLHPQRTPPMSQQDP